MQIVKIDEIERVNKFVSKIYESDEVVIREWDLMYAYGTILGDELRLYAWQGNTKKFLETNEVYTDRIFVLQVVKGNVSVHNARLVLAKSLSDGSILYIIQTNGYDVVVLEFEESNLIHYVVLGQHVEFAYDEDDLELIVERHKQWLEDERKYYEDRRAWYEKHEGLRV